jgi:hypothetical protein
MTKSKTNKAKQTNVAAVSGVHPAMTDAGPEPGPDAVVDINAPSCGEVTAAHAKLEGTIWAILGVFANGSARLRCDPRALGFLDETVMDQVRGAIRDLDSLRAAIVRLCDKHGIVCEDMRGLSDADDYPVRTAEEFARAAQ